MHVNPLSMLVFLFFNVLYSHKSVDIIVIRQWLVAKDIVRSGNTVSMNFKKLWHTGDQLLLLLTSDTEAFMFVSINIIFVCYV